MLILNKICTDDSTEDVICTEDISEIYSVVVLNTDTNEEYTITRSTSDWAYEFISKFGKLPFGFNEKYMFSTTKKGYSLYQTLEFIGKKEGYNVRYTKSWGTLELTSDYNSPRLDKCLCAYVFRSGYPYSFANNWAFSVENDIKYFRLEDILLPPRVRVYVSDTGLVVPYGSLKDVFSSSLAGSFSGALYKFKDKSKFDLIMTKAYTLKR